MKINLLVTNKDVYLNTPKHKDMTQTIETLEPLIELGFKMLQAGTLKKNVVRHWTNKGLTIEAAENLTELADCRFENFTHYKAR